MERVEPISRNEFLKLNQTDYDFNFEWKHDSLGKINNEIKVIDYG